MGENEKLQRYRDRERIKQRVGIQQRERKAEAVAIYMRPDVYDQMMRDEFAAVLAQNNPTEQELMAVWKMETCRRRALLPKRFGADVFVSGYDPEEDVLFEIRAVHAGFLDRDPLIEKLSRPVAPETRKKLIEEIGRMLREKEQSDPKAVADPPERDGANGHEG
jgi:hypothetical protein